MKEEITKAVFAAVLAAAGAYLRELLGPLIVLGAVMLTDYITGLARAWIGKELSSRVGVIGIIKKVGYLCVEIVAVVLDWVIQSAGARMGMELGGFYLFGLLVCFWMILNECISILENLAGIGVPLPAFLVKLAGKLKKSTENKGEDAAK